MAKGGTTTQYVQSPEQKQVYGFILPLLEALSKQAVGERKEPLYYLPPPPAVPGIADTGVVTPTPAKTTAPSGSMTRKWVEGTKKWDPTLQTIGGYRVKRWVGGKRKYGGKWEVATTGLGDFTDKWGKDAFMQDVINKSILPQFGVTNPKDAGVRWNPIRKIYEFGGSGINKVLIEPIMKTGGYKTTPGKWEYIKAPEPVSTPTPTAPTSAATQQKALFDPQATAQALAGFLAPSGGIKMGPLGVPSPTLMIPGSDVYKAVAKEVTPALMAPYEMMGKRLWENLQSKGQLGSQRAGASAAAGEALGRLGAEAAKNIGLGVYSAAQAPLANYWSALTGASQQAIGRQYGTGMEYWRRRIEQEQMPWRILPGLLGGTYPEPIVQQNVSPMSTVLPLAGAGLGFFLGGGPMGGMMGAQMGSALAGGY